MDSSKTTRASAATTAGAIVALIAVAAVSAVPNPVQSRIHRVEGRAALAEANTIDAMAAVVAAAKSILINGMGQSAALVPTPPALIRSQSDDLCTTAQSTDPCISPVQILSEHQLDLPPPIC